MRAMTLGTWKCSRATRADTMFELSPLETAMNASASLIPASSRTSRSNPIPTMVRASKPGGRRSNACFRLSMMETVWPACESWIVSSAPTRPHPMITTCIGRTGYDSTGRPARWPRIESAGGLRRDGPETDPGGEAGGLLQDGAHAAPQDPRPAGLLFRPPVLGGLRHRGDDAGLGRSRGRCVLPDVPDRGSYRPGSGDRHHLLPTDRSR